MARPLAISTYDGSGQVVHPDVIQIPGGFRGYRYWMAMTPYPNADDRLENPSLRASQDGIRWVEVPDVPDPVVPAPRHDLSHNADPDLAWHGGRLFMAYVCVDKAVRRTELRVTSTRDGVTWAAPIRVRTGGLLVSPALARHRDAWRIWYVTDGTSRDRHRLACLEGPEPDVMTRDVPCHLDIPGHVVWHVDAVATEDGCELLVAAYPERANNSRTALFHATSTDGVHFVVTDGAPLLHPRRGRWDNRMIYRSTFLREGNRYRIWYSAASWSWKFGIGHVSGPLDDLRPVGAPEVPRPATTVARDAVGRVRYEIGRRVPQRFIDARQSR